MTEWTAHRFSGGALALDLANTVVWKDDPERRFDRFQNLSEMQEFARAASERYRQYPSLMYLVAPQTKREAQRLIALRNAIDDWLRPIGLGENSAGSISCVLEASWKATQHSAPVDLEYACALSAIQFFQPHFQNKVKVCPACRWLFLDVSKNKSRRWCDMKVCGNRAKARAHYQLSKARTPQADL